MAFIEPIYTLEGVTFLALQGRPVLYIWRRQETVLYVGLSGMVLGRIGRHNVIGRVEPVLDGDVIEFHDLETQDWEDAKLMEQEAIEAFHPKYNISTVPTSDRPRTAACLNCKRLFKKKRAWQRWCSKKCRDGHGQTEAPLEA